MCPRWCASFQQELGTREEKLRTAPWGSSFPSLVFNCAQIDVEHAFERVYTINLSLTSTCMDHGGGGGKGGREENRTFWAG